MTNISSGLRGVYLSQFPVLRKHVSALNLEKRKFCGPFLTDVKGDRWERVRVRASAARCRRPTNAWMGLR